MKPRALLTTLFVVSFGAGLLVYAALRQEASTHATVRTETMQYNELTPEEKKVIVHRGTERAFTGRFVDNKASGTYICKHCNAPLFRSEDKFNSGSGWPSFDDAVDGAVERRTDADGHRTEIVCANCGAHLGHVFTGEGMTAKDTRHCVNSVSLDFIAEGDPMKRRTTARAIFASGCFWGTEHAFKQTEGVLATTVGYTGGHKQSPTYREVCSGKTGHIEAVEVFFDPEKTDYETLARLFFETHDPTQDDGQGPDIGSQYLSTIFYIGEDQKRTAEKLIGILEGKGMKIATQLRPAARFWPAEDYHQNYYENRGSGGSRCHRYRKLF